MKKIIFILMCLLTLGSVTGFAQSKKFQNKFDKNTKKVESERFEYSVNQYDCSISFWVLIDDETSRKSTFLALTFYSKYRENIEVNGSLVIGQKGNPVQVIELYNVKRSMTDSYYKTTAYYPIDDVDEFFGCNKLRVQTKMSNIDINLKNTEVKQLSKNYENVLARANQIYNVNTDVTFDF